MRAWTCLLLSLPFLFCAVCAAAEGAPAAETGGPVEAVAADTGQAPQADSLPAPRAATKLNLNTATEEQFATIPGVGPRMIHEFVEYRPYVSIRQFRREIGKYVDADTVAAYEKFVFVPIAPNECDGETLQQIPGVNATIAAALIAGRPYPGDDAFVDAVASQVGAPGAAAARALLASR